MSGADTFFQSAVLESAGAVKKPKVEGERQPLISHNPA